MAVCALAAMATLGAQGSASAQSNPTYVRLGPVNAARFVPDEGPAPHCTELAQRGFMAICFETRFRNDDIGIQWEELPHDVKAVVDHARAQPGITRVILLGHSGGSPMMSLYQDRELHEIFLMRQQNHP